jgi:hypothetical protein
VMHHRSHAREQPVMGTSLTACMAAGSAAGSRPPQPVASTPRTFA